MLAELSTRPAFNDPKWIFEIKWDGYRAIGEARGKDSRLYSRKGTSFNKAFPKIFQELQMLNIRAVIDGEIVVYDENGKPSFQHLQNYSARQKFTIQYQVFDILEHDGKNLCELPLTNRKDLLKTILPDSPVIRYCDHIETDGELLFDQVIRHDMEGIIAKKAKSKYACGERSNDWLKIKNLKFDDFIIVGFLHTDSELHLKSLVLGGESKGKIEYRGCVAGFSDRTVRDIRKMLDKIVITEKPIGKHERFDDPVSWVEPRYRCNVRYTEITTDGILRHPVFQGITK